MDWKLVLPAGESASIIRLSFDAKECQSLCAEFGLGRLSDRLGEESEWAVASAEQQDRAAQAINYCETVA